MKIEKAIESLGVLHDGTVEQIYNERKDAIGLGIEALKWRQTLVQDYGSWCGPLLPGETED